MVTTLKPIVSFTLSQLLKEVDPAHIHHAEHTAELQEPFLIKAYGSSLLFGVYSSHYAKNHKIYKVKVIFKDFFVIARDKQIPIGDAVHYAIEDLDVHITDDCPANLYFGYRYLSYQLGYMYGLGREDRFPKRNNPRLLGSVCKHEDKVLRWISQNEDTVIRYFEQVYRNVDFSKSLEEYETQHPAAAKKQEDEKREVDEDISRQDAGVEEPREDTRLFPDEGAQPSGEQAGSELPETGPADTDEEIKRREQNEWERQRIEKQGKTKGFSRQSRNLLTASSFTPLTEARGAIQEFDFEEPFWTPKFRKELKEAIEKDRKDFVKALPPTQGDETTLAGVYRRFTTNLLTCMENAVPFSETVYVNLAGQVHAEWNPAYPWDLTGKNDLPDILIPFNSLAALRAREHSPCLKRGKASFSSVQSSYDKLHRILSDQHPSLSEWNDTQKEMWLKLVADGVVEPNDSESFYKFGRYFKTYFDEHGQTLPYSFIATVLDKEHSPNTRTMALANEDPVLSSYGEEDPYREVSDTQLKDDYDFLSRNSPETLKSLGISSLKEFIALRREEDRKEYEFQVKKAQVHKGDSMEPEDLSVRGFSEDDFVRLHKTGHIGEDAYERSNTEEYWDHWPAKGHESLKSDYPNLVGTITTKDGREVEVRSSREENKYTYFDEDTYQHRRDEEGNLVYMPREEVESKGYPVFDTTLHLYDGDKLVGMVSDEFGTDGVWIRPSYRGQGLGPQALRLFRKQFPKPRGKMGRMTNMGTDMARAYYRRYAKSSYDPILSATSSPTWKLRSVEVLKEKMQGPMPGRNLLGMLTSAGVSKEELKWTGLSEALDTQDKLTLEQVLDVIKAHSIDIDEHLRTGSIKYNTRSPFNTVAVADFFSGDQSEDPDDLLLDFSNDGRVYRSLERMKQLTDEDGDTREDWAEIAFKSLKPEMGHHVKYESYSTPGGEDYSELILKSPVAKGFNGDPYTTHHWENDKGVLGHLRMKKYRTTDNKKLLLLDEIQSDFYQEMRKRSDQYTNLPDAPFQKTWMKLLFRRGLIEAIRNNCSYLGWSTGDQQTKRYSLDKFIGLASLRSETNDIFYLVLEDPNGNEIDPYSRSGERMTSNEVVNLLGKDLGQRLVEGAVASRGKKARKGSKIDPEFFSLKGEAVVSGGHGMRKFYDEMVVNYANDIGKKFGAKVQEVGIVTGAEQTGLLVKKDGAKFTVYLKREPYMNPQYIPLESFSTEEEANAFVAQKRTNPTVHALPLPPELKEAFKDGAYLFQSRNEEVSGSLFSHEAPELLTPRLLLSVNFLGVEPFRYDDHGMWFTFQVETPQDTYQVRGGLQPLSMILRPMLEYIGAPPSAKEEITRQVAFPLNEVFNFSFEIANSEGAVYRGEEIGGTVDDPDLRSQAARIFSTALAFLRDKVTSVNYACVMSYGTRNRLALYRRLFAQAGDFGGKLLKEFSAAGVSFALFGKQSFLEAMKDGHIKGSLVRQDGAGAASSGSFSFGPSQSIPADLMPKGATPRMVGVTFPGVKSKGFSKGHRSKKANSSLWVGFTGTTPEGKDFVVFDDRDGDRVLFKVARAVPVSSPDPVARPTPIVVREGGKAYKVHFLHDGSPSYVHEIESARDLALDLLTVPDLEPITEAYSQELIRRAVKSFGTTDNPYEAGYMLPDGTMLDFSGSNYSGNSYGGRAMDHRQVEGLDPITRKASRQSRTQAKLNFMWRTGAVRMDAQAALIDVFKTPTCPTRQQVSYLSELFEGRSDVYITLRTRNGDNEDYELSSPDRDEIRRVLLQEPY